MNNLRRPLCWAGILGALGFFSACTTQKVQTAAPPVVPVVVAPAVQKSVPVQIRVIGSVEAYSTIQVKAQIGGYLTHVYFREGQDVKRGQLLFQIDPRPYQESLNQAMATLAKDTAQLAQAEANLARDLAQSKNAETQAGRYSELQRQGIISKEQNDQFRTNSDALQDTARADRAAIDSARAAANGDRSAIERAKLDVAYCSIHAPLDGRTGNLLVKEGNLVKANADTAMVVINQVTPIYVTFSVPEQHLAAIRRFMAVRKLLVEAIIPSEPEPVHGFLTFVDNAVDAGTGTIQLKATFSNSERRLWPGRFVNVVLTLDAKNDVIVVPSEAVQTGQKGQYVFVVKADNKVENRAITLAQTTYGQNDDRELVVASGLQPGDVVVTDGQLRLVPGATVRVVKTGGEARTGGAAGTTQ